MAQANAAPVGGHDGPYDAPVTLGPWKVQPDWIDYNGHMNVAYYTMALDTAMDALLEDHLGIGESFVKVAGLGPYVLQLNAHYLAEMHKGETFHCKFQLLDHDSKRIHVCQRIIADNDGREAAFFEALVMNVDLTARRSAPYPDQVRARLQKMQESHDALPRPERIGATIGIRRR